MTKYIIALLTYTSFFICHGQNTDDSRVQSYLKLGVGASPDYLGNVDNLSSQVPHFYLYHEIVEGHLLGGQLRKGIIIGYAAYDWQVADDATTRIAKVSFLNLGGRLSYYWSFGRMKPYLASELFYTISTTKFESEFADGNEDLDNSFNLSALLGLSYEIGPGTEVFAEGGVGFMNARFGVTIIDFLK